MNNREFLRTCGGKLAAIAAPVMAVLAFIATDPTAAILLSDFLPGPLRLVAILAIAFVAYVLPLWSKKRDDKNTSDEG